MREIRCKRCHRLLMKGTVIVVEIKCPKCGCIQNIKRTEPASGALQAPTLVEDPESLTHNNRKGG